MLCHYRGMAATAAQALQRAYDNYARILVLCTQTILAPNRDNVDAVITAADGAGIPRPKPTWSADGESFDWTGYQAMIIDKLEVLEKALQRAQGPYEVRTIGRV